jgi:hypothetical protein
MKSIPFNLSALWRSVRLFVAACACVLIVFSNAVPAYSLELPNPFASDKSDKPAQSTDPTQGEDQLLGIEEGAQRTINRDLDLLSGQKVQQKSAEGINEVQGGADIDKMKRPENTQSQSIEGILEERLEEATGQK